MRTPATASIAAAQAELEAAKEKLSEAIRAYPRPVEETDPAFYALVAERRRVLIALGALTAEDIGPLHASSQELAEKGTRHLPS